MNGTTSAIRVRTRYGDVEDFVVGYSPFFDTRGIFIRTRRLQEVGSRLRFELQLADGSSVFRGEGVVDEVREPPRSASGMHVRITKLDRDSKLLFERVTTERQAEVSRKTSNPLAAPRAAVVLGGAAAEPRHESRAEELAVRSPSGPIELFEDVPSGRTGFSEAAKGRSELSGDMLDEIADGIEMTLDSVLLSGPVDPAGAAGLGGFFGSPAELAAASGQHTALSGGYGSAIRQAGSVMDQLAAFEADLAAESGEVPALPSPGHSPSPPPRMAAAAIGLGDDPFEHQSTADAVFEHSLSDQFLATEDSLEMARADRPYTQSAASEIARASDLPPARDLPPLPPLQSFGLSGAADDLGVDVSLALASNVQFTPQGGVDAVDLFTSAEARAVSGDADVVDGQLVDEFDMAVGEDVGEAVAEPSQPYARVALPAAAPVTAAPMVPPSVVVAPTAQAAGPAAPPAPARAHFRLKDEGGPALDSLLFDILEENRSTTTSSANIPALDLDGDDPDQGGPDAIDELLARDGGETEGLGKKKKGLLSRLFGRKG